MKSSPRPPLFRLMGVLLACVLVPLLPFVVAGAVLEPWIESFVRMIDSPGWMLLATFLALAADLLLPVPSSAVITLCGAVCGIGPTILVASAGLSVGSVLGYEFSRWIGPRLLITQTGTEDVVALRELSARHGIGALWLTRPLPLLAETAVLLLGTLHMPRLPFYLHLMLAHTVIASVYAICGKLAQGESLLGPMLAVSVALPFLLTLTFRWLWKRPKQRNLPDHSFE